PSCNAHTPPPSPSPPATASPPHSLPGDGDEHRGPSPSLPPPERRSAGFLR
uniref:Uncharacterized protein n=1 Tax=Aegilops tauschii subsp. strangulata TaxID=200361 RepID=A0A453QI96_AEGTS